MGMGYGANWADVIQPEEIKKVGKCKALWNDFMKALEAAGTDGDSFAQAMTSNGENDEDAAKEVCEDEDGQKKIVAAYDALVTEFEKQTGLTVGLSYHSMEDDGDRYDDVDGSYWWVDGFRTISTAGRAAQKKWKIEINTRGFVNFG